MPKGSILGCSLAPFWGFGPLESENEKVCLDCTGVCGLHIQLSGKCTFPQLFPSLFLKHCAGGRFSRFVRFYALLRLPVWHLWAPVVVKNRSEKMVRKIMKRWHAREPGWEAVGPLKENRHQTIRLLGTASNTPWRA